MPSDVIRTAHGPGLRELLNPWGIARNLFAHRHLLLQLARRDIQGRYRAAQLGLLWAILTPLVMLAIYTFVFTVIFPSRLGRPNESQGEFALSLFCGLLLFNFFSEVTNRAPTIVISNVNYVKKVVFPLEVLVVAALLSALFNMLVGLAVWLVGRVLLVGLPPLSIFWLPVVILPLSAMLLAIGWVLSSLGVFVRDVGHAVGLVVQVLFFATPIFYSLKQVPEEYQFLLQLNPMTHAMEDIRRALMTGGPPDWVWWWPSMIVALLAAILGYAFFMKSKRAFGDVL